MKKHVDFLENLADNVPQEAKPAILLARERSSRYMQILENLGKNIVPGRKKLRENEDRVDERS